MRLEYEIVSQNKTQVRGLVRSMTGEVNRKAGERWAGAPISGLLSSGRSSKVSIHSL